MGRKRRTTEEFIEKAKKKHGETTYSYQDTYYVDAFTAVLIFCLICQKNFLKKPVDHLQGFGCQECTIDKRKLPWEEFIKKAIEKHGNKYDYSESKYIDATTKIWIKCLICDKKFEQRPSSHINEGSGCPPCGHILAAKNTIKISRQKDFLIKAKEIHGDRYDYSLVKYKRRDINIEIICQEHGIFVQTPIAHIIFGHGCQICGKIQSIKNRRYTTEDFIKVSTEKHGNKYDYSLVNYIDRYLEIKIICLKHGEFLQKPYLHLLGIGCLKCSKAKYSKVAIEWLTSISIKENIFIQHAENKGEFKIPGTNLFVDGYCELTNTIYEFHGDYWHGNPNKYKPDDIHPIKKIPYGEIYKETLERENKIKSFGYNLIVMWESDYKELKNLEKKEKKQKV